MTGSERRLWLALAAAGIAPAHFDRMLADFGSVPALVEAARADAADMPPRLARAVLEAVRPAVLEPLEDAMRRRAIQLVTREDAQYPPLLRLIEDAPLALFVRGIADMRHPRQFAIVGSRACTRYGAHMAQQIAGELATAGVVVVSGMARGVDTAANMGCVTQGKRSVAVLGCGVDVVYPPENRDQFALLLENGGALVSEYPPGAPPARYHFPRRNRIISGICSGMLLVEGSQRSGAMITVRCALEQGREVYALPGPADSPNSFMPLELLREGGQMAADAQDILRSIRWLKPPKQVATPDAQVGVSAETSTAPADAPSAAPRVRRLTAEGLPTPPRKPRKRAPKTAPAVPAVEAAATPLPPLAPDEQHILDCLAQGEQPFSALQALTGLSVSQLNSHLTMLEIQEIIEQFPGRVYKRAR